MADTKISALTAATTPLAGTEVLPIVQNGATKNVAVSDLTAGRAVTALSMTLTNALAVTSGGTGTTTAFTTGSVVFAGASGVFSQNNANLFWDDSNKWFGIGTAAPATKLTISNNTTLPSAGAVAGSNLWIVGTNSTNNINLFDGFAANNVLLFRRASGTSASPSAVTSGAAIMSLAARAYGATGYSSGNRAVISITASETWTDTAQGTRISLQTTSTGTTSQSERLSVENNGDIGVNSGNINLTAGNLVPGTAAKGINFTANSAAAGMTSQLLNWYEEGTWTPSLGGSTTYTKQSGKYVRVGKMITIMAVIQVNVLGTGSTYQISGLPYYSLSTLFGGVTIGYFDNLATNVVSLYAYLSTNDNYLNVVGMTAAANSASATNIFGNSARIEFSATYMVNS